MVCVHKALPRVKVINHLIYTSHCYSQSAGISTSIFTLDSDILLLHFHLLSFLSLLLTPPSPSLPDIVRSNVAAARCVDLLVRKDIALRTLSITAALPLTPTL